MNDYNYFLEACKIENLQEHYDLSNKKLEEYFKKNEISIEINEIDAYKNFFVDVDKNIVSIKAIAKKDNSEFILNSITVEETPEEFVDVIINYQMFIVSLINLHQLFTFYINFYELKLELNNEDYFNYFAMSFFIFSLTSMSLKDFLDLEIKIMYIDNDKIMMNDNVFLEGDKETILNALYLLRVIKSLQMIKKTIKFIQDNYNSFYEDTM